MTRPRSKRFSEALSGPADGSAEAAPSKQTPAEAANGDEEDEDGKSTTKAGDKKPAASKAKKKPRRR